jgi:hypothetical protein
VVKYAENMAEGHQIRLELTGAMIGSGVKWRQVDEAA